MNKAFTLFLIVLAIVCGITYAQEAADKECEVCIGVVEKFDAKVKEDKLKTPEAIEKMFRTECKAFTHPKEKRLCWYLGAAADSATNILREVSRPLSIGVPPTSICKRLKSKDSAICGLRYVGSSVIEPEPEKAAPKPKKAKKSKIPWEKLKTLRVKQLKQYLGEYGVTCTDCVEKGDYIKKLLEFKGKDEL